MMISAFSMCCGYYERVKSGTITPNVFYRKRYLRILPFFAFLNFIALAMDRSVDTFQEVYANLTLAFNLLQGPHIETIGVGWFLGVIFVFYMLFPFFTFLIDNKRRAWLVLLITLGLLFIAFTKLGNPTRTNIVFCMPYFLIGGIIYLYRNRLVSFIERRVWISTALVVICVVGLFLFREEITSIYIGYSLELLMFAILLTYALKEKNIVLDNPFTRYISKISMEIYLCHMVIFRIVEKLHLEQHVANVDLLYVITCIGVIIGAVCFAKCSRDYLINPLMKRFFPV